MFYTPPSLKDSDTYIEIYNDLARKGYKIDIQKRSQDFIVWVNDNKTKWECGTTPLDAILKMKITLLGNDND